MVLGEYILETYDWVESNSDPRVNKWPLVSGVSSPFVIVVLYIALVKLGPKLMQDRKPLNIKNILIPYNFFMVILSVYMFTESIVTGYLSGYSLHCAAVDYSDEPLPIRVASLIWLFYISKIVEILDTVFFILRKKDNQVTFLHVYHHASMVIGWWLAAKYCAGGQSLAIVVLNSLVHVIMYMYYGLAAIGPHMQRYLWWKRYMTTIQLVQFVLFLLHTGYNLMVDCPFPDAMNLMCLSNCSVILLLFANFYHKEYVLKRNAKLKTAVANGKHD